MKKGFLIMSAAAVFSLILSTQTMALEGCVAQGKPSDVNGVRYELWKDQHCWHLRWTGAGDPHHFSGMIKASCGKVLIVDRHKIEEADKVWRKGNSVRFDAGASSGMDGFDFRWRGRELILDLEIDGKPSLEQIHVGSECVHPTNQPFLMYRPGPGPRPAGKYWVPGHYDRRGRWIPSHCR